MRDEGNDSERDIYIYVERRRGIGGRENYGKCSERWLQKRIVCMRYVIGIHSHVSQVQP